jgi:integrase
VERPKKEHYIPAYYDSQEINRLFELVAGTDLEVPVKLAAFYGLRREEVLGLRWKAIDFEENTITINHTVTQIEENGKTVTVASDTTKTKSSMRTLPMVPQFRELLLRKKEEQAELRRVCGKCYNKEFLDYVCVNALGERIKPSYLTNSFPAFVVKNGMRRIRFHDLRHPDVKQATKNNEYLIEFLKIMRIDTLLQVHYSPFLSSKASWRVVSISIRLS